MSDTGTWEIGYKDEKHKKDIEKKYKLEISQLEERIRRGERELHEEDKKQLD